MLEIDGSAGDGGGQVLRSSLSLAMIQGKPFRMEKIRMAREMPGLLRQHLSAVQAAAGICKAQVSGAELGSTSLSFTPGTIEPGNYEFSIGAAGSASLLLQTLLPALLLAKGNSKLNIRGGTHNPNAPPSDFLQKTYLSILKDMGAHVQLNVLRPGFYPAGGGELSLEIQGGIELHERKWTERGSLIALKARALISHLDPKIAERELKKTQDILKLNSEDLRIEELKTSAGPGNVLLIEAEHAAGQMNSGITEVFTGFGIRGVMAEEVAQNVCRDALAYLESKAFVGAHLADQMLVPLVMAGGGEFTTLPLSKHTHSNLHTISQFTGAKWNTCEISPDLWRVKLEP